MSDLQTKPGTTFDDLHRRCVEVASEAFDDDRVRNRWGGQWRRAGVAATSSSPVDGSATLAPPMVDAEEARDAVAATVDEHVKWADVALDERVARVHTCIEALERHRELLSLLLVREIGKPWPQATTEIDRTASTVRWYADNIAEMLFGRTPLPGPVSNIASWNYPINVLLAAMLVEAMAGNAAIAKVPSQGGVCATTLGVALACEAGLPFTLISGSGPALSPVLVQTPEIGCVSFVGGRSVGGRIAGDLVRTETRHMLEQEGLNAWGVWEFSDWDRLAIEIRKGFQFAKQRCTAYPRYVVQRKLFADFLAMYLSVLESIRFGNPLAVSSPDDDLPALDYGPLISAAKVGELRDQIDEAVARGGIPLSTRNLDGGWFIEGQDTSTYVPPVALLEPPRSSSLYHAEPFGPVDTIVCVDSEAELLAEMNSSNGALVASLAIDDVEHGQTLAEQLRAFKVGINASRSRGDRDEAFGGWGSSWKGAFVGGRYLVQAVTQGPPEERLYGNFATYRRAPDDV
jgi:acyl-CoA reductase-like NAD-dependent aldehyde dehydrogenase